MPGTLCQIRSTIPLTCHSEQPPHVRAERRSFAKESGGAGRGLLRCAVSKASPPSPFVLTPNSLLQAPAADRPECLPTRSHENPGSVFLSDASRSIARRTQRVQGAQPPAGGLGVSPSFTSPRAGGRARRASAIVSVGAG